MRVVFISAECEPWAKTGGLGDVVDALARALGRPGPDVGGLAGAADAGPVDAPVDVYLPRYRTVPVPASGTVAHRLRVPDPTAADGLTDLSIVDVQADGYRLRLVDHAPAYDRDAYYGDSAGDYKDNAWRFGLLCRAALESIRADGEPVDVIHAHDWQATPAIILRDVAYDEDPIVGRAATMLTVHNLAYHGWTPREGLPGLAFPRELAAMVPGGAKAEGIDLLRTGIERAELVNTVSPGYAKEALTPEYGMGLDPTLRAKGDRFIGIINGLDMTVWNPATDRDLAANYSREDRAGKAACRHDLVERVGLDPDDDRPVLAMIGRLDPQKGFDLVAGAAERLLSLGTRLVILGTGDARLLESLRTVAEGHSDQIALIERFDRALARQIYAGADFFLMPSRFEPCGQGQMIAMRYGTPPIVRRTGGLADTVVDVDDDRENGTGFVFDEATPAALLEATRRALRHFARDGRASSPSDRAWSQLVDRGMEVDWAWETGPAPDYVREYRRAAGLRTAGR